MKNSAIKIAHIGGGSRYWARDLLSELAQSTRLSGAVDLYDIDEPAAQRNVAVAEAIFARPEARSRFKVRAVRKLEDALRGADFVILSIEPGPITCRYADLEIPARHGLLQSVGDTTGPGGILRALRAIPIYTGFARKMAKYCPTAWVINYTNPMTLCTAALYDEVPKIKAFGCCHEVFHTQERLAKLVADKFGGPLPRRQEIDINLTGVNHFTWVIDARWRGHDLIALLKKEYENPGFFRSRAPAAKANKIAERWFQSSGVIASDLARRFGALGAAGDRHLAEFVPWYLGSENELHRWGVVLTPYSWRFKRARSRDLPLSHYAARPLAPSIEEGVKLIEALAGHAPIDTNVNLPNRGQAPDLPLGHIVETNAKFRHDRVIPLNAAPLPAAARALVTRVMEVQQLTLKAALERDVHLAFQAVLADPLMRLSTDRAWTMFRAMLHFVRKDLPGWKLP